MRFSRFATFFGAIVLAFSAATNAGTNSSYSHLGIGLTFVSFDENIYVPSASGLVVYEGLAGVGLDGSWQFHPNFFVFGAMASVGNEGHGTEMSEVGTVIGIGGAQAISHVVDIVGHIGFLNSEAEVCIHGFCATEEVDGYGIGGGIRAVVAPTIELSAGYDRVSLNFDDGSESYGTVSVGALFGAQSHGFTMGYAVSDDLSTLNLGYRYTFR